MFTNELEGVPFIVSRSNKLGKYDARVTSIIN